MLLGCNLDSHPYTGIREVKGKLKVKAKGSWIDGFFNGTPNFSQVKNITQGKIYNVTKIEGIGDCEDVYFINDVGQEARLGSWFFEEIN